MLNPLGVLELFLLLIGTTLLGSAVCSPPRQQEQIPGAAAPPPPKSPRLIEGHILIFFPPGLRSPRKSSARSWEKLWHRVLGTERRIPSRHLPPHQDFVQFQVNLRNFGGIFFSFFKKFLSKPPEKIPNLPNSDSTGQRSEGKSP